MFERIRHAVAKTALAIGGAKTVTAIESVFGGLLAGMEVSQLKNYESYLRAASHKVWALWACCNYVATVCMDTNKQVQRIGGDGQPVKVRDLDRLLSYPNQFETWGEFIYKWLFHMFVTGNAFAVKDQANLNGDRPKNLFLLNPARMKITVDPRLGITGYIYCTSKGQQVPYEVEEIIHWKFPHPQNEWWGLGRVESAEDLFQNTINRQEWESRFWKNGAAPSGLLTCKTRVADAKEWAEAKEKWLKEYGGTKNSGKTAWLSGEWEYIQLGLSAVEMQNLEQSHWSVEQICHQCGVPLSVIGVKEASNYATARVDDMRVRRDTVKPALRFFADTFNTDCVQGFGEQLELVFMLQGLVDIDAVATSMTPLFDRGILSINEMRIAAGQPTIDDPIYDQHFINAGLVPLELSGIADLGQTDQAARSIVQRFIMGTTDRPKVVTE